MPRLRDELPALTTSRAELFAGDAFRLSPTPASRDLVSALRDLAREAFGGVDPPRVRDHLSNDAFFRAWSGPRQGAGRLPHVAALTAAWLRSIGAEPGRVRHDVARVRAVTPDGHTIPEAAPAYGFHRDTWYANPRAQLNAWIPLWDVPEAAAFSILPRAFGVPVPNTSATFDAGAWARSGGFQAYATARPSAQHHPVPRVPPDRSGEWRPATPAAGAVLFSAAHLHGTPPNDTPRTRFTVEIRFAWVDDVELGRGAPDPDNASTGSTWPAMAPLAAGT